MNGSEDARAVVASSREAGVPVLVPAVVLAETLFGDSRDARVNQKLKKLQVVPVSESIARVAAKLRRLAGMSGVTGTVDALVAAVAKAFDDWAAGTGYVSSIFAENMTWEIVGHSAASRKYGSAAEFIAEVLQPFGAQFSTDDPFRPVAIRQIVAAGDRVVVLWGGEGTTTIGTTYRNTYAWFMTLDDDGKIADGIAFYDSISFNELWDTVRPD